VHRTSRIYVAGGQTLIGAALIDHLHTVGQKCLVGLPPDEPELTFSGPVEDFFAETHPEFIFVAAGESGGIQANIARPADLMLHNLLVTVNVLQAAHVHGVSRLLYLGSSCSYPRGAAQPLRAGCLMTGSLEPTSEAYAMAKLAGIRLCQAYQRQYGARFITAIPANAFGPHDDFGPEGGHVIPALLRRFHEAKEQNDRQVIVWGTGTPRREFVYGPDLADACCFVLEHYDGALPINLGSGSVLSIAELAEAVAEVVGYRGRIEFDSSKPDGAPVKALDSGPLHALGWRPRTSFRRALEETYDWYRRSAVKEDPRDVPAAV
jgi:GDP-L-fucose synthase